MSNENVYLALGCYGRTENGFVLCPSVENRILKIDHSLVDFDNIVKYLEAVKLFDRPMLDQNSIRHLVFNLQDKFDQKVKRLWKDQEFHLIERFMHMHKPCGLYCQLIVVNAEDDFKIENQEEKPIYIRGKKTNKEPEDISGNNIAIRSRYG